MPTFNTINQRNLIIGGAVGLALIAIGLALFFMRETIWPTPQEVAVGEPVDIVLDIYTPWLEAVQGVTEGPYALGLDKSPVFSKELRKRISDAEGYKVGELDPVLCQVRVPTQITTRRVSQTETEAEVLVVSRDKAVTEQAIVELTALNGGWYIEDIRCSPGEFAPEREFSFDIEGFLLKSVVAPLNPNYWHLVYEQDGVQGYVAPLYFSTESMCTALDGSVAVCDPSTFIEPSKAHVQGEMTETGVKVKNVKLIQ